MICLITLNQSNRYFKDTTLKISKNCFKNHLSNEVCFTQKVIKIIFLYIPHKKQITPLTYILKFEILTILIYSLYQITPKRSSPDITSFACT